MTQKKRNAILGPLVVVLPSTFLFNAILYEIAFVQTFGSFFAIETEDAGIQRDTQGYIRIHVYPIVSWCFLVYPRVSP